MAKAKTNTEAGSEMTGASADLMGIMDDLKSYDLTYEKLKRVDPGLTVCLVGPPGVAKSSLVRRLATEQFGEEAVNAGKHFMDVRASYLDQIYVVGFPDLNKETGKAEFVPFSTVLPDVKLHGEKGILLLDEFNLAPPEVQKAFYQLLEPDRKGKVKKIGSYEWPKGWRIILAGNNPEDAPGFIKLMPPPLKRRMVTFEVVPPKTERSRQALFTHYYNIGIAPPVIGFLKTFPHAIHNMANATKERNFPCLATWEDLSDSLKHGKLFDENWKRNDTVVKHLNISDKGLYETGFFTDFCAGHVGFSTAMEFEAYTRLFGSLPDTRKLLLEGVKAVKIPDIKDDLSMMNMMCTLAVTYMKDFVKDREIAEKCKANFFDFLELKTLPDEMKIMTLRDAISIPDLWSSLKTHDRYKEFAMKNIELIPMN